jgi:hypothetical protein
MITRQRAAFAQRRPFSVVLELLPFSLPPFGLDTCALFTLCATTSDTIRRSRIVSFSHVIALGTVKPLRPPRLGTNREEEFSHSCQRH